MKVELGFNILEYTYSKKVSACSSGQIVAHKGNNLLISNLPEFSEKEKGLFLQIIEELKFSSAKIEGKADVYFFLKNYCIENLILLNKEQREKIILWLEIEAMHESILTPLLKDPDFEEIVINGSNKPILVYHRTFGWLTTNLCFTLEEKIKNVINKMAAPLGRQLSYHTPILNAVLDNGSRLNATINPIAFSGINCTIRKFKETPFTPIEIIETKTITRSAMAFLWLAMQTNCSVLVCGNTGSGKTTTLNSLFCFLPQNERIVVVEETPELVLPQTHKVKLNTCDSLAISLDKLIENTFRMRPDRVIVGEIRTKEESKAFINTMLAGQARGSYATFHAESANEALERLRTFGIEDSTLLSIDLIIVQKRIQLIDSKCRREERRVTEICETVKINNKVTINPIFEFDFNKKTLIKTGESKRIISKIKQTFMCDEKKIIALQKEREQILEKLKDTTNFNDFFTIAENEF